ncbi:MAG: PaaI family thioesterase [Dehalococcoidia bacterium]|nr:PaaI family thioesterase [Dehalococcoidia bacterium]
MNEVSPELKEELEHSPFPTFLGFRLLEVRRGYARASVKLQAHHANFIGTADGALIMSLADYVAAVASRTLGRSVGIQFSINMLRPASIGSELFAECRIVHPGRTVQVGDVTVTDDRGRTIARATGTSLSQPDRA